MLVREGCSEDKNTCNGPVVEVQFKEIRALDQGGNNRESKKHMEIPVGNRITSPGY